MLPKKHILYGFIFSLILFLIFPINLLEAGLIFFSSFLIDFDHYLYFVFTKKSFNLKEAYFGFKKKGLFLKKLSKPERKKYVPGFYIFHGLETLIVLGVLGYFISSYFYLVLFGAAFHLILDYIYCIKGFHYPLKISIIFDFFQFKNLKKL